MISEGDETLSHVWKKVTKHGIVGYRKNSEGNFHITIPEATASLASWRMIKMINWINDEFQLDAAVHPEIFSRNKIEHKDIIENFVTRNTSRILSYVNHVCLLEKMLRRLYSDTIRDLQNIDPSITSDSESLGVRTKEVDDYFVFRNKVSAHTSYGSPRGDNATLQFHSLATILSSSYENGDTTSFAIGAVSLKVGGEQASKKIPTMGLKILHPKFLEHIEAWEKMIIDPCLVARKKLPFVIGDTKYVGN